MHNGSLFVITFSCKDGDYCNWGRSNACFCIVWSDSVAPREFRMCHWMTTSDSSNLTLDHIQLFMHVFGKTCNWYHASMHVWTVELSSSLCSLSWLLIFKCYHAKCHSISILQAFIQNWSQFIIKRFKPWSNKTWEMLTIFCFRYYPTCSK